MAGNMEVAGLPAILLLRLKGPMMGWGGVRIDAYGDVAPIPLVSMLAGLLSSALGIDRRNRSVMQELQDAMDAGVAVINRGQIITDYQITNLGKPHMTGPMWTVEGVPVNRAGSGIDDKRITHKPYIADADVLVAIRLGDGCPVARNDIETALAYPAHPLFLGRACCPPSLPLFAGWMEDQPLNEALSSACLDKGLEIKEIWLPAILAQQMSADMLFTIANRRDWMADRHVGVESYLMRKIRHDA